MFDILIHGPGSVMPEQLLRGIREHLCGLLETGVIWGPCEPATRLRGLVTLHFLTNDRKYTESPTSSKPDPGQDLLSRHQNSFDQCNESRSLDPVLSTLGLRLSCTRVQIRPCSCLPWAKSGLQGHASKEAPVKAGSLPSSVQNG